MSKLSSVYEVVGKLSGVSRKTKRPFNVLFTIYKVEQENVEGYTTERIFVNDEVYKNVHVGELFIPVYNRFGQVVDLEVLSNED